MFEIPQWFLCCNPGSMRNMIKKSTYVDLIISFAWENTNEGANYWVKQSCLITEDGKRKLTNMVDLLDHFDFNLNTLNDTESIDMAVDMPFMIHNNVVVTNNMFVKIDTIIHLYGTKHALKKAIAVMSEISDQPKRHIRTIDYIPDMTIMATMTDMLINGHKVST